MAVPPPTPEPSRRLRLALIGDAQSPHLLKWARALAPEVELWVASSRGFAGGFDGLVPTWRRLALEVPLDAAGGNWQLVKRLPELGRWLREVDADWLHAHYLTSHGTLAWAAKRGWRLRARIVGSAWGSDILVTPRRSLVYRWLTQRVLRACALTTSDSQHMAGEMAKLGAGEVLVFPFGLERMPSTAADKEPWLFFANRGLEPIYRPDRVLQVFRAIAEVQPEAQLVVANDGSLRRAMEAAVRDQGLDRRVQFTGRLSAAQQDRWYARAQWYLSLPASDSVAVSVLEAMAHGCIPILSDLPANHELVSEASIGMVLPDGLLADLAALQALAQQAAQIGRLNRAWVQAHGLFDPAVAAFLDRLRALTPQSSAS
ncbi:MAG: glycosyltransferase [Burkholderiales bacterium]